MNILGMGPMEILLIVVLALIVFGPARLPEIMGQVGRAIADFRRATSSLSDEFNRTIQAELNETRQVVEDTRSALTSAQATVTQAHTSVTSAVAGTAITAAPQRVAAPPAPAVTGANGTNGSSPTSVAPSLADTTQWSWETASAPQSGSQVEPPAEPAPPRARQRAPLRDELLPPY